MAARPQPGELLLRGRVDRKSAAVRVECSGGEDVNAADCEYVRDQLAMAQLTILDCFPALPGRGTDAHLSFVQELVNRGYDLNSLRLSVFLKSRMPTPANPRKLRLHPGLLQAKWSRMEYDSPDLCLGWSQPCQRADSALLYNLFARSTYTAREVALQAHHTRTMLTELPRRGFAIESLKLSVRHKDKYVGD